MVTEQAGQRVGGVYFGNWISTRKEGRKQQTLTPENENSGGNRGREGGISRPILPTINQSINQSI